jgi:uncharacterized protein
MLLNFLILIILLLLIEIYSFQAFKTLIENKWLLYGFEIFSLLALIFVLYGLFNFDRSVGQTSKTLLTFGLLLLVLIPKLLIAFVLLGEDFFRLLIGTKNYFSNYNQDATFLPARRKFVSQVGLGIAAVPFLSLIYGMTIGKYNFKVIKQNIFFPDLPDAFEDFTITHISDIHSGSFDNPKKINYAIELINEQNSDILLFTGDIVNAKADEMHPWIASFKKLIQPEFGKFSILGNHDYGAYLDWKSEKEKEENFFAIKDLHRQIDFKLLMNEHVKIKKNNQEIAIVGVENWGKHFGKMGDVMKATEGIAASDFKILMSHDPSHWEEEVQHHVKNIQLTLSGHTHGMQFGIEIPGFFKWSLAQYMYKQWAGLYENLGRYIYVNRGFGFHAYPGRVGIMPEITVLRLKKGKKVV